MSAPDSPTGLPRLDPNDRESTIVTNFNRLVDMIEARMPSYFASSADRDAVWGTPGIYDRPQAIIGGKYLMWNGDHWATVSNIDETYSWSPGLFTNLYTAIPNDNGKNFSSAATYLPVSDNLYWFKIWVSFTSAGAAYLNGRDSGDLISASVPFTLSTTYQGGGGYVSGGGNRVSAGWRPESTRQISWSNSKGPLTCGSYTWQTNDIICGQGVVSV